MCKLIVSATLGLEEHKFIQKLLTCVSPRMSRFSMGKRCVEQKVYWGSFGKVVVICRKEKTETCYIKAVVAHVIDKNRCCIKNKTKPLLTVEEKYILLTSMMRYSTGRGRAKKVTSFPNLSLSFWKEGGKNSQVRLGEIKTSGRIDSH